MACNGVRASLLGNAKLPCSKQILRPTTSARLLPFRTIRNFHGFIHIQPISKAKNKWGTIKL